MIAYAESSAVLAWVLAWVRAWVLGEPEAEQVRTVLAAADRGVSSTLTGAEGAMASWATLEMSGRILRRATAQLLGLQLSL